LRPVGNALCGVPRGSAVRRNGTEAVPYSDSRASEFPDTLKYLETGVPPEGAELSDWQSKLHYTSSLM
jgi:hypothetical protein